MLGILEKSREVVKNPLFFRLIHKTNISIYTLWLFSHFVGFTVIAQEKAEHPQWANPKIPAPFAKVLQARGQLDLVDRAFDRLAYYPWTGFAMKDGGVTVGLGDTLDNGQRVAYIATKGRKYREVADTLVDLAQKMGPRPSGPPLEIPGFLTVFAVILLIAGLVTVGISAIRSYHNPSTITAHPVFWSPQTTPLQACPTAATVTSPPAATQVQPPQSSQTAKSIEKEETVTQKRSEYAPQPSKAELKAELVRASQHEPGIIHTPVQREVIPAVFDVNRVVADLERVANAGWLTRGWTKSAIKRDLGNQTEVLEGYGKYFPKAIEVLRSRRDLEQTKREITDFEASQILRQKHMAVEYAQLDAQQKKAELETAEAEAAKKAVERNGKDQMPAERENYDL